MSDTQRSWLGFGRGFWKTAGANFCFFVAYYFVMTGLPLAALAVGGEPDEMGYVLAIASALQILLTILFVGPVLNWYWKRPFLVAGSCFYALVALLLVPVRDFATFMAIGGLVGVGVGLFSSTSMASALTFAPESRRGEAIGIIGTVTTVAITIGPPLALRLMQISLVALYAGIFVASAAAAVLALTIREPALPPVHRRYALNRVVIPGLVPPAAVIFAMCVMYGSLITYFPKYAIDHGIGNPGFLFSAMGVAVLGVRFWAGRLADRVAKIRIIVPGMFAMIATMLTVAVATPTERLLGIGALFGLGYGTTYPATLALMDEWASEDARGSAMAMYSAAFTGGIGLGPVMLSPLIEGFGFPAVFVTAAGVAALAIAAFVLAYRRRARLPRALGRGRAAAGVP